MAYSKVGIINLGLIRAGSKTISSLTETSDQAVSANAIYDYILDEVLESSNWSFAKERVELTQLSTAPSFGYDYQYSLPVDCLRVISVSHEDGSGGLEYVIEGGNVLTDEDNTEESLYCEYIKRVTDPAKYTSKFIKALSLRLAADLAFKLMQISGLKNEILAEYQAVLIDAKDHDRSQDYVIDEDGSDDWQTAGR